MLVINIDLYESEEITKSYYKLSLGNRYYEMIVPLNDGSISGLDYSRAMIHEE